MEKVSFKNPPLAEIVAEVRWDVEPQIGTTLQAGPFIPASLSTAMQHEELYANFSKLAATIGFTSVERLIPQGFPALPYRPVYRYHSVSKDSALYPLYQLGPGIFSANIIPPHESWESFRPVVVKGLELLLECIPKSLKVTFFSSVMLRYVDAFKENLVKGMSTYQFISDVLDIKTTLPDSILQHCSDKSQIKPTLTFSIPLSIGQMSLMVGEGIVNNENALIMDTTVMSREKINFDKRQIMKVFDTAHDIIYTSFVGMTEKIHKDMVPQKLQY